MAAGNGEFSTGDGVIEERKEEVCRWKWPSFEAILKTDPVMEESSTGGGIVEAILKLQNALAYQAYFSASLHVLVGLKGRLPEDKRNVWILLYHHKNPLDLFDKWQNGLAKRNHAQGSFYPHFTTERENGERSGSRMGTLILGPTLVSIPPLYHQA